MVVDSSLYCSFLVLKRVQLHLIICRMCTIWFTVRPSAFHFRGWPTQLLVARHTFPSPIVTLNYAFITKSLCLPLVQPMHSQPGSHVCSLILAAAAITTQHNVYPPDLPGSMNVHDRDQTLMAAQPCAGGNDQWFAANAMHRYKVHLAPHTSLFPRSRRGNLDLCRPPRCRVSVGLIASNRCAVFPTRTPALRSTASATTGDMWSGPLQGHWHLHNVQRERMH
jgi:hypothetical protein